MSSQSQAEIEKMLVPDAVGSIDDWCRVKKYLAQSFASYLDQEIEPVWEPLYEQISPKWGFAFGIRSASPLGGPLGLEWYGVISHTSCGLTYALVLLFSQNQRVIPSGGKEYLYFKFDRMTNGSLAWRSLGWSRSEMGERDSYQHLSDICQRMQQTE